MTYNGGVDYVRFCFNDSVKAILAYAQHCGKVQSASTVAIFTDKTGNCGALEKRKKQKMPTGEIRRRIRNKSIGEPCETK